MKQRVEFHYLDGQSYTYKGYFVDGWVPWEDEEVRLVKEDDSEIIYVDIFKETLYIEDSCEDQILIYKNPRYKLSSKIDITTAKQRCKYNNPSNWKLGKSGIIEYKSGDIPNYQIISCGHLGY